MTTPSSLTQDAAPPNDHTRSANERTPLLDHGVNDIEQGAELERNFSFMSALGLAFTLLNTWTAMAAALPVGLASGGTAGIVYGLLVSGVGQTFVALSLAEICHVLPLSGAQYDWAYVLAPPWMKKSLSFFTGWMACAAWVSLFAAAASLTQSLLTGVFALWIEDYDAQRWQNFLIMIFFVIVSSVLNIFGVKILPFIDWFSGVWSITGMVTVMFALLVCSRGSYEPAKVVFGTFTNTTGWPNGFAFILSMLQSTLTTSSCDAVAHMVEEMPQPAKNAPKIMVLTPITGVVTAWPFMVVLLFCMQNWDGVLSSAAGPLLEIYHQSTESRMGATLLMMFNLLAMFFCTQSVCTIVSRMLMSFCRDRGLGNISRYLAPVDARLKVPLRSILFATGWVIVFGLIYLGSSVAMNGILSAAVLFLEISFAVPIILILVRGDKAFEGHSRTWTLGRYRPVINILALCFLAVTSVAFTFPPELPVTAATMNYASVVFVIVVVACAATWCLDGRKHFFGPEDLEERLKAAKES